MHLYRASWVATLWLLAPVTGAQTLVFSVPGDAAGDFSGGAVALVGDVDGDGAVDFAVGATGNDVAGSNAGMVRVYSGRTRLPIHTWYGSSAFDRFGASVAGIGDVDGDLHDDVVVGAPGGDYADVLSGQSGSPIYRLTGAGGQFGWSVAGGGQLDADGIPDVLVGAPFDTTGAISGGALYAFSGANGAFIRSHVGTLCGGQLGYSVTFQGDANSDGRDEYAVGRTGQVGCSPIPEVRSYDGASGTLRWSHPAAIWNDQLGYSVAALSDVTGDGIAEVLAGAPQDPGVGCGPCNGKGYVRLLDGASGAQLWQVNGNFTYSGLGTTLAALGDVDGDGFEDFATSQPESDGGGGSTQPVQVRSGLTGALLLELPPFTFDDGFGRALASGDANDDGLRDLLVGTPRDDAAGTNSGASYVYTIVRAPTVYCEAKVNSQGCTPVIFSTGTASLSSGNFRVKAQDVLNKKNGLLFWGRAPTATPFQGAFRCVAAPIERTPLQVSGGNPPPDDCSGLYSYQFTGVYMQSKGIQAGDQIYCQYWSRDPAGFVGTNLTGGLAFYVEP